MANNFLICDGDSITAGDIVGTSPYTNFLTLLPNNSSWVVVNNGIDSETLATMVTRVPTVVNPQCVSGINSVVLIFGGTNDINGGASAATVLASLQTYCLLVRNIGYRVIVGTLVSRGDGKDAIRATFNASVVSTWPTFADGLADFGGNVNLAPNGTNCLNSTYYIADAIHPNTFSDQTILAPIASTAVNTLPSYVRPSIFAATGGVIGSVGTVVSNQMYVSTGELIVACVRWGNNTSQTVTGVADTAGNTYTPLTRVVNGTSEAIQYWYCANATGNANNVVTATFSANSGVNSIYVWNITNGLRTSPLDVQTSGTSATAGVTSAAFTTTHANEMILALATHFATGNTYSPGAGYTLDNAHFPILAGGQYTGAEHKAVSSIQTSVTATLTGLIAQAALIAVSSFQTNLIFGISGNAGAAGATLAWSGGPSAPYVVTADGSGNYNTGEVLQNGTYTVTPSLTGVTFFPSSQSVVVSGADVAGINFSTTSPAAYSVPDSRAVTATTPNSSRTVQGTKIYDVPKVDSRAAGAPVDSRVSPNIPVDSRVSPNIPQNSRASGTFGPGE